MCLIAKFCFDTAENEPSKNLQKIANFEIFPNLLTYVTRHSRRRLHADAAYVRDGPGDPRRARRAPRLRRQARAHVRVRARLRGHRRPRAKLKISIGEGPNQTNFSDRRSVEIL